MIAFEFEQLVQDQATGDDLYLEFLRQPSLSMGLYVLKAGTVDPQSPHREDEVYVVLNGRAQIMVAGENQAVQKGSVVFVGKQVEHRFHTIEEDLQILVFFAPAESQ
ncbi:MAG: cupin domain-containing protein [Anaerolineae bacterium]|nr:cupin domain-containing protein [Anaerolineae bacterium]